MKKQVMILIILFLVVGSMMAVGQPPDGQESIKAAFNAGTISFSEAMNELKGRGLNEKDSLARLFLSTGDLQSALKDKKISYSQAYDAAKVIADNAKSEAEKKSDFIKQFADKLVAGKLPSTVSMTDLSVIGDRLGIQPQATDISNGAFANFKGGDIFVLGTARYTVSSVKGGGIYFYQTSKDSSISGFGNEAEFTQWKRANPSFQIIRTEGESKEQYLARVNAQLEKERRELDEKEKAAKSSQSYADSIRWSGTWLDNWDNDRTYQTLKSVGSIISGGIEAFASLGEYRALSNLLFPELTKEWSFLANNEVIARWADLPNFIATEICLKDDAKRANRPGQYAAFITTSAGTEQSVVAIQAERSPNKFPILCTKNEEDEWTCPKDLVCKDNTFCYKDKKAEKPEEGYFYKITWGVTAPTDEAFTPYVDESGVVTKFNVYLDDVALYRKKGVDKAEVLQLQNGGHDGGMIVRYLPTEYRQACIKFKEPIKDRDSDSIGEACVSIVTSTGGVVEFANSGKTEPVTSTSADVELEI